MFDTMSMFVFGTIMEGNAVRPTAVSVESLSVSVSTCEPSWHSYINMNT